MKELKETMKLMTSADYRERFAAEYWQAKIRYEKLKAFNTKIEAAQLVDRSEIESNLKEPIHDCPAEILKEQQHVLGEYLHILEIRAVIENIDLEIKENK